MSDDTDLREASLGQILVPVRDVTRATAFYRDVLGLRFLFDAPGLAFFDAGGVRLMLAVPEAEHAHPGSVLYYRVGDVQAAHAALVARGAESVAEPHVVHKADDHDLWMGFLEDGEGNTFAVMSEVARS